MFSHLPAPIWQLYYLLPPVTSVIPVFFHKSLFSHQSFNPFRPGKFRSTQNILCFVFNDVSTFESTAICR
jgi:hypothetical protein